MGNETIFLNWGTLKGWKNLSEASAKILERYFALVSSMSAMEQKDSPEQKELLYQLLRQLDGRIINDWDGKEMTVDEAIAYVANYPS